MRVRSNMDSNVVIIVKGSRYVFNKDFVQDFSEFLRADVIKEISKFPEGSFEILSEVEALTNLAPEDLDTFKEVADALENTVKRGQKTILVLDNNEYENAQQAIDSASVGDILVFGAKASGWGDITLKGGVDIVGLAAPGSDAVRFGSITFNPTSGTVAENTVFISNIIASPTDASKPALEVLGTVALRLRTQGCYFYKNSGSNEIIKINNSVNGSSVYLDNVMTQASTNFTGVCIDSSVWYLRCNNPELSGGNKAVVCRSGLTYLRTAFIDYAKENSIIDVLGGIFVTSEGTIKNTTVNGSGVLVESGAQYKACNTEFDVAEGNGYCVLGSGAFAYSGIFFPHVPSLNPRNINIKNTLTTFEFTKVPNVVA